LTLRGLLGADLSYLDASAGRHALALGFLTLMVTGFSMRVIPVFEGVQLRLPGLADIAFWLLLASVTLRVPLTLAPLLSPDLNAALIGFSGVSGLVGLILWGTVIWRTLDNNGGMPAYQRRNAEPSVPVMHQPLIQLRARPINPSWSIRGDMTPAEVVERFPVTLAVFASFGFDMLTNEHMRNTVGRRISIEQAARMRGVPLSDLLAELNSAQLASAGET
ncbi:MAG: DUF1858 domain-containing protein, partial [Chloroflexi bacterium]|nr:DUF1858 domain-containing protein [Chloroflexota bacterium]